MTLLFEDVEYANIVCARAGICLIVPCLDRVRTIDLRLKTFDLASVEVLTHSLTLSLSLYHTHETSVAHTRRVAFCCN